MSGKAKDTRHADPEMILTAIADALPERVEPRCPHFGTCGGCQLQHLPQTVQLEAKRGMLMDVLAGAGLRNVPEPAVHAAEPWRYRNRARMRVQNGSIGYSRRASNEFLLIDQCPILSPLVWHAAHTLQVLVRSGRAKWPAGTQSFEVFVNGDETSLQLSLQVDATVATVDRDAPRDLRLLCDALLQEVPALTGAGLLVAASPDPSLPRRVQASRRVEIARWGPSTLLYRVGMTDYRVTRNAFFQVNRFLTATMVHLVTAGRSGALACDLFAGAGLFSVPLAQQFDRVVAVEIGEPAATDLAAHLSACGKQHLAVRQIAFDFLAGCSGTPAPDLIVLDPPRAGLGRQTTLALAGAGAPEIVYVSCDAASFAADGRTLLESGYKLETLHLLDLFPQTSHTETIAVFRR